MVLTRTSAIPHLTNITIAPLTRTIRDIDAEAIISPDDGVPELSAANLDNILTIPRSRLERGITHVSDETMADVLRAIRFVFDMGR